MHHCLGIHVPVKQMPGAHGMVRVADREKQQLERGRPVETLGAERVECDRPLLRQPRQPQNGSSLVRQNEREAHEPADRVRHGAPCRLGPPDSYEPGPVVDELEDHAQLEQANQDQLLGRELGRPLDIQLACQPSTHGLQRPTVQEGLGSEHTAPSHRSADEERHAEQSERYVAPRDGVRRRLRIVP